MNISAPIISKFNQNLAEVLKKKPTISIFGMGYVGIVSAACLSSLGFSVLGVDLNTETVFKINKGKSPICEKGLDVFLEEGNTNNLLNATTNGSLAVMESDISFISVGTPTSKNGGCELKYIMDVAGTIGRAIKFKPRYHLVVIRSSIPPGTTLKEIVPRIEAVSGKKIGQGWGLCFNPEFLREGVAVDDFFNPSRTVIGASDKQAGDLLTRIYDVIDSDIFITDIETAEMVKYVDNTWHATKVVFANEVGRLSKSLGIDSHKVMNLFLKDHKLNLSSYYLKPGFAYGGSCLPKEVRAMKAIGDNNGLSIPLISSLNSSNEAHIMSTIDMIFNMNVNKLGFLGVTFKSETDDLRQSPILEVMASLDGLGKDIKFYDPNFLPGKIPKAQLKALIKNNPHLSRFMEKLPELAVNSVSELNKHAQILVVSHNTIEFQEAVKDRTKETLVLDLVRLFKNLPDDENYNGIGW